MGFKGAVDDGKGSTLLGIFGGSSLATVVSRRGGAGGCLLCACAAVSDDGAGGTLVFTGRLAPQPASSRAVTKVVAGSKNGRVFEEEFKRFRAVIKAASLCGSRRHPAIETCNQA